MQFNSNGVVKSLFMYFNNIQYGHSGITYLKANNTRIVFYLDLLLAGGRTNSVKGHCTEGFIIGVGSIGLNGSSSSSHGNSFIAAYNSRKVGSLMFYYHLVSYLKLKVNC